MSRAYDDVFSHGLLDVEPAATFSVHVMRDSSFGPEGVALEIAPAGVPHVRIVTPREGPVVLEWTLDERSQLHGAEELVVEPVLHELPVHLADAARENLEGRRWCGPIAPERVSTSEASERCVAVIRAHDLPDRRAWRTAWGYELSLVTRTRIEEMVEAWVILESA